MDGQTEVVEKKQKHRSSREGQQAWAKSGVKGVGSPRPKSFLS